jgi:hypothetical protein
MHVDIYLYGKIRRFGRPAGESHVLQLVPNLNETLASLLERLEIPVEEIYSIFLNSKLLAARSGMARWIGYQQVRADPFDWNLEIPISTGDRIGLFGRDMAALVI